MWEAAALVLPGTAVAANHQSRPNKREGNVTLRAEKTRRV